MKIQVWKRYTGNRASELIEEGIYDTSDKKLFGLASYLIDNGNAVEHISDPAHEEIARQITVDNEELRAELVASIKTEQEVTERPKRGRKKKDDS